MIKIGTVCYITGDHSQAGQCCTVTSALYNCWTRQTITMHKSQRYGYDIVLASNEKAPWGCWNARPDQLIPIAPPGVVTNERKECHA